MLLSKADIERLEKAGFDRREFARLDRQGYVKLRNRNDRCVLYDVVKRRCRVYRSRPLGCRVYPVIYSVEEGVIVDVICPVQDTVTQSELERKGRTVVRLLRQIDREARASCLPHESVKQS